MDLLQLLDDSLAGAYTIERPLGQGGMATVYLADDLKHHRKVAIKVLRPDLAETLGVERFLREIRIAAQLTHPHILPLHDSGEADGVLYYVMPYVEGESLRQRLEREDQLSTDEAIRFVREVADALDCAHRQGIVHRDIKPDNVLLIEDHAVVADFGIASAVTLAGEGTITQPGFPIGTPRYMSPEQAFGLKEIDNRTDIFSLGCLLYEMLLGTPPQTWVDREDTRKKRISDLPSAHRTRLDQLPDRIEQALAIALAKLPEDRFTTAGSFAGALIASDVLERIARQIASTLDVETVLRTITEGLVEELNAAFARIWLLGPGDLCATCHKADWCSNRSQCLHLAASAGLSTNLNGEFRRVPLGALKIGRIAQGAGAMTTNNVLEDSRLPNKEWLRTHGLQSFAGYPLVCRSELLGVLAVFTRRSLADDELRRFEAFANEAAVAIKNAQLYEEVEQLKQRLQMS